MLAIINIILFRLQRCFRPRWESLSYRVFTRSSKHRANVEQTSSKHRGGSSRPIETPPLAQM